MSGKLEDVFELGEDGPCLAATDHEAGAGMGRAIGLVDGQDMDLGMALALAGGAGDEAEGSAVEGHGDLPCGDALLAGDGVGLDEPGEAARPWQGRVPHEDAEGLGLGGEVACEGEARAMGGGLGEDMGGVDAEEVASVELAMVVAGALGVGAVP